MLMSKKKLYNIVHYNHKENISLKLNLADYFVYIANPFDQTSI